MSPRLIPFGRVFRKSSGDGLSVLGRGVRFIFHSCQLDDLSVE